MQLNVMCNLSYATTQIYSCMCRMQLNFSCKRQLQNPKFLVVINFLCLHKNKNEYKVKNVNVTKKKGKQSAKQWKFENNCA
jgi:hypothetical protein